MIYLTADIGSTYTKLVAIDTQSGEIKGTACAFTTIQTDVREGFHAALRKLTEVTGDLQYDRLLCCSSAAGGLKMVALGLVPELTAKAARLAASSAGAKVVKTYSFEISKAEQSEIEDISPDLVLLCGGTDGGNKEVITANAKRLCDLKCNFAIVVAGNKSASHELQEILERSGKQFVITENVMPEFNKLNIEPARKCIEELFISRIVDAKGLTSLQKMSSQEIIPTPLAVMRGCEILSKGTDSEQGIGDLLAVDLGGATTDIYSMSDGHPSLENMLCKGLPEPYSKRSVEGDLGMRYSLGSLADAANIKLIAEYAQLSQVEVESWISLCLSNPDTVARPESPQQRIEEAIARVAIEIATERHSGLVESVYTPLGQMFALTGKDLSEVPTVIGIGGALINSANPSSILEGSKYNTQRYMYAKPKNPEFMLDKRYIFASMGLLSSTKPELALKILKEELKKI
ncbi:MAG: methylaspartate mutase accessory protein GlmL [Bacteroidales bacterium]|nr:methylaspartate mutase accessory protein GlmL [Bacteroidales bacterium]MDD4058065.1 methylaspartate mutase accessory protein GlmL [Bacteroidales bacterium]